MDCRLLWHLDFDVTHLTALTDDIWQVDGFLTTWLTKVWIDYSLQCRSLRCQWLSCHINVNQCHMLFVVQSPICSPHWSLGHWRFAVLTEAHDKWQWMNLNRTNFNLTSCQFQVLTWHMTHADLGLRIPDQALLTSWKQINLIIVNADWFEHIACIDHMFFCIVALRLIAHLFFPRYICSKKMKKHAKKCKNMQINANIWHIMK